MKDNKMIESPESAEMESVFLPRISGEESCVFVGLNGKSWQIPRGKKVDVPVCVARVLDEAEANARIANEYAQAKQKDMESVKGA